MDKQTKHRNGGIDQVRLLFCLAVLAYHLGLLQGGYLAVCGFFVLSGYLSTVSFLNKKINLKRYCLNRFLRLYVPLLICVCLTLTLIAFFPSLDWISSWSETTSVLLGYDNYWQISAQRDYFTRRLSSPFTHLWYIAILLQFELFFPFLCIVLRNASRKVSRILPYLILFILMISSFLLFSYRIKAGDMTGAYYGTLCRIFSLFAGMMTAFAQRSIKLPVIRKRNMGLIVFYLYFCVQMVMFLFVKADSPLFKAVMLIETLLTMRMLDYAAALEIRNNRIIEQLAMQTYEIYLLHYPLNYILEGLKVDAFFRIPLVLIGTILLATVIHQGSRLTRRERIDALSLSLSFLLCVSTVFGFYRFLKMEDHTEQMEELKQKLAENEKLIEEKNEQNKKARQEQQEEWYEIIDSLENAEDIVSEMLKKLPVTGIGDSILVDLADRLYEKFPNGYFDGKISRDLYNGNKILEELKEEGLLSDTIILCLATNGDFLPTQNEKLLEIVGDREVFWVDAVSADEPNFNEWFASFAKEHPNIHIIEWEKIALQHPEYLYYDGIHVIGKGVDALTRLIYDEVYDFYLKQYHLLEEGKLDDLKNKMNDSAAFYGNDALLNAYPYLKEMASDASYHVIADGSYESLYEGIKTKAEDGSLESRIILLFDAQAGLDEKQYSELAQLCKDRTVCILDLEGSLSIPDNNVKVIDFSASIREHPDYLLSDHIHLSDDGSVALAAVIREACGSE